MTDDVLERISRLEHVTVLRLGGSKNLTDAGVAHLERMTELRELDLGGCPITDRSLEIVARLPKLEQLGLWRTTVTDAGAAHLARCRLLSRVDLAWTPSGDGAIRALAGQERLTHLRAGDLVTDAGLAALHDYPVFKSWQGGRRSSVSIRRCGPNMLMLRGTSRTAGWRRWSASTVCSAKRRQPPRVRRPARAACRCRISASCLRRERRIHAVHRRDAAFAFSCARHRSRRRVRGAERFALDRASGAPLHNLRPRFTALADIPTLRALSVSCRNVDDAGLSALPRFPSLRELMPMDVPDDGYRHIGRCEQLESLVLMYCRDTGDVATSHLTKLPRLKKYFASYTRATDRTPQYLSEIDSLESIDLSSIPGITNAGIAALTMLPRLRELHLGGMQHVDLEALPAFREEVRLDVQS
jgi:hypothetical protein